MHLMRFIDPQGLQLERLRINRLVVHVTYSFLSTLDLAIVLCPDYFSVKDVASPILNAQNENGIGQ